MVRGSRHKSTRHGSRDARESSESEYESSLRDRKGKESGGRVVNEYVSSEKRRVDSKDAKDFDSSENLEKEERGFSKRRKERYDDGTTDRWNGGSDEDHANRSKKSKTSADSKNESKEENFGLQCDGEELKKSSGKSEGRHSESNRKEGRNGGGLERDGKGREGRGDNAVATLEHRQEKQVENSTEKVLQSPELDGHLEIRFRGNAGSFDGDKHKDDLGYIENKKSSSKNDVVMDGRRRSEKHKDEKSKEKYWEDADQDRDKQLVDNHRSNNRNLRDEKYWEDADKDRKQRDRQLVDNQRSNDINLRDEKDAIDKKHKRDRLQDSDSNRELTEARTCERNLDAICEKERDQDRHHAYDRDQDRHHAHDRDQDRHHAHDRDQDRHHAHDRDQDRHHAHDRDQDRHHAYDRDQDRHHANDRDQDRHHAYDRDKDRHHAYDRDKDRHHAYDRDKDRHHAYDRDHDQESRRGHDRDRYHDRDRSQNRSRSHARDRHDDCEYDFDRDRLHLQDECTKYIDGRGRKKVRNDHDDSIDTRSRTSKNSHHSNERNRSLSNDKVESVADRRRSRSRSRHADGSLSSHRRRSPPSSMSRVCMDEYRHADQKDLRDRYAKREETFKSITARDQSNFSGLEKGSKYTYVEKSNEADGSNAADLSRERSLNSKNIDITEGGRRHSASVDTKDISNKDRKSWDLPGEKPSVDEPSQAESSFYSKASKRNPSLFHPYPAYRAGVDISFDGPVEDDSRFASNSRFRRSGDPNLGRMHVNTWRGVPNWTTPLPNGFIPFQQGPPHGGFPSIMPQFPAPPLLINHSGIPYCLPDAERFSSHLHPLGWPNMLDGSSPSHLHGWDGNSGIFRDESHVYAASEWEENKQTVNGRGWESRADLWKKHSGFVKKELPSQPQKDAQAVEDSLDDVSSREEVCDQSSACLLEKTAELRPGIPYSAKESPIAPELVSETSAPPTPSMDDNSKLSCFYLSKLDISAELASPDLYHQCRTLMDIEHCETADKETALCIIPEGRARAVAAASLNSTRQSLLNPSKNPIFQRAMDLYKKQRTERKELQQLVSGGPGGQSSTLNDEVVMVPVSTSGVEDVVDVPASILDNKEVKTTDALEKLEDSVSNASREERHLENSEELSPVLNSKEEKLKDSVSNASREEKHLENSEEPSPDLNLAEVIVMVAPEQQMNSVEEKDTAGSLEGIANGDDSTTQSGVENCGFDKAVSNPSSSFTDDDVVVPSEGGCEGLMPGSIESESLISSRIHHSPESTH